MDPNQPQNTNPNPQPNSTPVQPASGSTPQFRPPNQPMMGGGGSFGWQKVALIVLGIGFVIGLILSIKYGLDAAKFKTIEQAELTKARTEGYDQAASEKEIEKQAALEADRVKDEEEAKLPYRSYFAPQAYGNFEIKFPKNWNVYSLQNEGATKQMDLRIHPDNVTVVTAQNGEYAFRLELIQQNIDKSKRNMEQRVKNKKVTLRDTSVSGIAGVRYEGEWADKRNGVMIIVPVRDKSLYLYTDGDKYRAEYEEILKQSKIIP